MLTEAYVAGLTKDNAQMLLDRARALGLPVSVVRTVDGGFIVPAVLVQDDGAKPSLTGTAAREDEPESESEEEPERKPAPRRRGPNRRTKPKAVEPTEPTGPTESTEPTADAVTTEE